MLIKEVGNSESIENIVKILHEDGGVIIKGFLDRDTHQGLKRDMENLLTPSEVKGDEFLGKSTKRRAGLFNHTDHAITIAMHPQFLETAKQILQTPIAVWAGTERLETAPDIHIGVTMAIQLLPGQGKQPLHRDDSTWLWRHPNYGREARLQIMIAVSEFTAVNGATQVIPGSHKWDDDRVPRDDEAVQAVMNEGDALLWLGSTYHGGGQNNSDAPRTGVTMAYDIAILRQEENQYLTISKERIKQFPTELQELLGWKRSSTYAGYVDIGGEMASPTKLLTM
ncbi:ectoine hydroxylase-related dioxygenase (phytanoyl-CoA dioxygenase family) [Paraburkholderia sp. BL27I4N3]|uniref:phytanoyl-CoA dioxygenase family protein n=1 Tax=Paraburkholderia sp. BL27I4N3 TaxID=1938805 RepID=UPI000E288F32|nr:phytanoyl-CoA dioxygenase family protein [Paraburkholderia sp. BL27I4N3]REE06483.1 ectoine hydroxylase-related dioxygenase (phytanoyl-CoA dioxygenase family) [Paraburkholderia sp. BL27I4N3]